MPQLSQARSQHIVGFGGVWILNEVALVRVRSLVNGAPSPVDLAQLIPDPDQSLGRELLDLHLCGLAQLERGLHKVIFFLLTQALAHQALGHDFPAGESPKNQAEGCRDQQGLLDRHGLALTGPRWKSQEAEKKNQKAMAEGGTLENVLSRETPSIPLPAKKSGPGFGLHASQPFPAPHAEKSQAEQKRAGQSGPARIKGRGNFRGAARSLRSSSPFPIPRRRPAHPESAGGTEISPIPSTGLSFQRR